MPSFEIKHFYDWVWCLAHKVPLVVFTWSRTREIIKKQYLLRVQKKGPEKVYFFQSVTQAGRKKKYNHKKRIFEKSTCECSLFGVSFKELKVKGNPVKEKCTEM